MLDFIKTVFASAIGFVLTIFLFFFILFIFVVMTSKDPEPFIRDNSVLNVKLSGVIAERPSTDPFEQLFSMPDPATATLLDLENNLKKAAVDEKIEGVLLEIDFLSTSWPVLQHMRRSLMEFRENSGKFVYATTNDIGLNEQGYYLATAADSIFAPPNTMMMFDGFAIEGMFLAGAFEKAGIEADVIHKGRYKSAGDSFTRTDFSDADREQLTAVYSDIVEEFESAISARTGMSMDETRAFINQPPRLNIEFYHEQGLIDALVQTNTLQERIKTRIGQTNDRSLSLIPNRRYARVTERTAGLGRPARESIAVIYAEGVIMPDMGDGFPFDDSGITIKNFSEALDNALKDSNVKAIVVRINSPGGAGSTSDTIWQLIREASEKKPVIASMGAVAASGGYYIAMAADQIVAEKTTVTGSIGVIGMRLNMRELLEDKLGLSFDEIRFHTNANWLMSPNKDLTPEQREAFEYFIDSFYDVFVNRVAESRGKTYDEIHAVAQGRIWSGADALDAGLIDTVGGLDDAIRIAAEKAGIEEYSLKILPREKSIFELFTESSQVRVRNLLIKDIPFYEQAAFLASVSMADRPHVWTIMPYVVDIR